MIPWGRDAADVAISTAFGAALLTRFVVTTEEIIDIDQDNELLRRAA